MVFASWLLCRPQPLCTLSVTREETDEGCAAGCDGTPVTGSCVHGVTGHRCAVGHNDSRTLTTAFRDPPTDSTGKRGGHHRLRTLLVF